MCFVLAVRVPLAQHDGESVWISAGCKMQARGRQCGRQGSELMNTSKAMLRKSPERWSSRTALAQCSPAPCRWCSITLQQRQSSAPSSRARQAAVGGEPGHRTRACARQQPCTTTLLCAVRLIQILSHFDVHTCESNAETPAVSSLRPACPSLWALGTPLARRRPQPLCLP